LNSYSCAWLYVPSFGVFSYAGRLIGALYDDRLMGARLILAVAKENAGCGGERWLGVIVGGQVGADFWQRLRVVWKTERKTNRGTLGKRDTTHNLQ
jgi:hypothetical protein